MEHAPHRRVTLDTSAGQLQTSFVDVSDQGITWVAEEDGEACVTVPWAECAAVVAYDDGSRRVIGRDGMSVLLFPERWDRWEALRSAVDTRVPPGCWAPQRQAPSRAATEPPVVEVRATSDAAWLTVGVALLVFVGLMGAASQAQGFHLASLAVLAPFAALSALPLAYVRRRRARREAGLQPIRVRRYRGVASWPTRYVVVVLALSAPAAAWAGLAGAWLVAAALAGVVVRAVKELHRRSQRNGIAQLHS